MRGTKFIGSGAVTPGPSWKCDITSFVKGRPESVQQLRDSETGIGGVKTYRTIEGGELAPKVVLGKLGLLTPKLRILCRISVEKAQNQGPPKTPL